VSVAAGGVVRVWRGAARPSDVAAYLTHFRARVEPALRPLAGFRGAEVLTRPTGALVEIIVQTRWASRDAVAAFAGPDSEVAVVEPEALAVLAEHDPFVRHFTVAHAGERAPDP
jgi:heme-degrading monooxygenase HmoA